MYLVLELIKRLLLLFYSEYTAAAIRAMRRKCTSKEQGYCIHVRYVVGTVLRSSISMTQNSNEMTSLPYTIITIKEINELINPLIIIN